MTSRFSDPAHPGERRILTSGSAQIGAVFPPVGTPRDKAPWVWRLWCNGRAYATEGRAKTEEAARAALLGTWHRFLIDAHLREIHPQTEVTTMPAGGTE